MGMTLSPTLLLLMMAAAPNVVLEGRIDDPLHAEGTLRLLPAPTDEKTKRSFRFNARPVATIEISAKGAFRFPSVPPGSYELSWDRATPGAYTAHALVKAPSSGIVVRPSQTLRLEGKVIGLKATRAPNAELQAVPERSEYHLIEVAPDGSFAFAGLDSGEYELTVGTGGLQGTKRRSCVKMDGTDRKLEVRFGVGWTLKGKLVDASGQPSSGVVKVVELLPGVPPLQRVVVSSEDEVVVEDLIAEKVEVIVGTQSLTINKGDPPFRVRTE